MMADNRKPTHFWTNLSFWQKRDIIHPSAFTANHNISIPGTMS
jgi:hypothetical protein